MTIIRTNYAVLQASLARYGESRVFVIVQDGRTLTGGVTEDTEMPPLMSTARVLVNREHVESPEWSFEAEVDVSTGRFSSARHCAGNGS